MHHDGVTPYKHSVAEQRVPPEQSEHSAQKGKQVLSRHATNCISTLRSLTTEPQSWLCQTSHSGGITSLAGIRDSVYTVEMGKCFKPGLLSIAENQLAQIYQQNMMQLANAPPSPCVTLPLRHVPDLQKTSSFAAVKWENWSLAYQSYIPSLPVGEFSKVCLHMYVDRHPCMHI